MKKEMSSMHMAIEFAKHVLQTKVTIKRNGKIGQDTPGEEYHPREFKLLLAQLEHNGEEVFKEWVGSVVDEVWELKSTPEQKNRLMKLE